ncbi:semaphorin-4D-like [Varanus komodoensis]|uniref:semaphorin-4D-like n=1 Tax=Varanus komodoensis TaxID=61221 RepID=UPI001CF76C14|nr:semaphorin-4D-like [Varanus komodoensis]
MGRFLPFCLVALWGTILQLVTRDLVNGIPRKTVPYQPEYLITFWKSGVSNFSTLLVSEETNTLYVGAKDYILALDLDNISQEITREPWLVPEDRWLECLRRGKSKAECHNYIRVLHKINTTGLYICGTNAFHPACRHYMVINNKTFQLQRKAADGRGKCPFEPTGSYASLMFEGSLYSATSNNFLGTEPIILRSLKNPLRTEFKASWLNGSDDSLT